MPCLHIDILVELSSHQLKFHLILDSDPTYFAKEIAKVKRNIAESVAMQGQRAILGHSLSMKVAVHGKVKLAVTLESRGLYMYHVSLSSQGAVLHFPEGRQIWLTK